MSCQECVGEGKQLVGEMDGSMIPVVLFDEETEGDKRKTRKLDCKKPNFAWSTLKAVGRKDIVL